MCQKFILIYIFYCCLIEIINAQTYGAGMNGGDILTNIPSAETAIYSTNSVGQSQAYSNVDNSAEAVQSLPVQLNPSVPEAFLYQGNVDDLARSARGAQIGGFGNAGIPPSSLVGAPIVTGTVASGMEDLTRMSEGMLIAQPINPPPNGLSTPVEALRDVSGLVRTNGLTPGLLGPVNSAPGVVMPTGQFGNTLLNTAVGTNNGAFPTTPINVGNAINAIQANGIAGIPTSTPVHGELNQLTIPNALVNSVPMGGIANSLSNSATLSGVSNTFLHTPPGTVNGLNAFGTPYNNVPTFPGRNYAGSKSILASLTGIDPASLGTNAKFMVKSASPISPTGLTVQAENLLMEGKLAVAGKMPFLGSVTVDGVLPDGGKGTVMYECGNGNIGMVSEGTTAPVVMGQSNSFARTGVTGNFNNANINRLGLSNNIF